MRVSTDQRETREQLDNKMLRNKREAMICPRYWVRVWPVWEEQHRTRRKTLEINTKSTQCHRSCRGCQTSDRVVVRFLVAQRISRYCHGMTGQRLTSSERTSLIHKAN